MEPIDAQMTAGLKANAMLFEYNALRAEMALYHRQQNQSVIIALLGTAAVLPLMLTSTLLFGQASLDVALRLFPLCLSLFVLINAIAFVDRGLRVKRIASYLHGCLRPSVSAISDHHDIWNWELFKKSQMADASVLQRAVTLAVDRCRLAFFWLIPGFSVSLYWHMVSAWFPVAPGVSGLEQILLALNVFFAGLFILASVGGEETTGAVTPKGSDDTLSALGQ